MSNNTPTIVNMQTQVPISVVLQIVVAAVLFAGFLFPLRSDVNTLQNNSVSSEQVSLLNARLDTLASTTGRLELQLAKPRFTEEDYEDKIEIWRNKVGHNQVALIEQREATDKLDDRLRKLENEKGR